MKLKDLMVSEVTCMDKRYKQNELLNMRDLMKYIYVEMSKINLMKTG